MHVYSHVEVNAVKENKTCEGLYNDGVVVQRGSLLGKVGREDLSEEVQRPDS